MKAIFILSFAFILVSCSGGRNSTGFSIINANHMEIIFVCIFNKVGNNYMERGRILFTCWKMNVHFLPITIIACSLISITKKENAINRDITAAWILTLVSYDII